MLVNFHNVDSCIAFCHSVAQEGYGYLLKLKLWTLTKAMMTHHGVRANGGGPHGVYVNQNIH